MKKLALLAMMVLGSTSMASAGTFSFHGSARASVSYEAPRMEGRLPQVRSAPSQLITVRDHRTNQSWEVMPCHDTSYNVSGFYQGPAGDVQLVQRGNRIYGTFAQGGQMNGVIENGKITYTWTGNGYNGRGYWYVDGHGKLIGMWGANSSDTAGGNWNLVLARR